MFFNFVDELRAMGISYFFDEHIVLLEALEEDGIDQAAHPFV
jgi:hypothetical protein